MVSKYHRVVRSKKHLHAYPEPIIPPTATTSTHHDENTITSHELFNRGLDEHYDYDYGGSVLTHHQKRGGKKGKHTRKYQTRLLVVHKHGHYRQRLERLGRGRRGVSDRVRMSRSATTQHRHQYTQTRLDRLNMKTQQQNNTGFNQRPPQSCTFDSAHHNINISRIADERLPKSLGLAAISNEQQHHIMINHNSSGGGGGGGSSSIWSRSNNSNNNTSQRKLAKKKSKHWALSGPRRLDQMFTKEQTPSTPFPAKLLIDRHQHRSQQLSSNTRNELAQVNLDTYYQCLF